MAVMKVDKNQEQAICRTVIAFNYHNPVSDLFTEIADNSDVLLVLFNLCFWQFLLSICSWGDVQSPLLNCNFYQVVCHWVMLITGSQSKLLHSHINFRKH